MTYFHVGILTLTSILCCDIVADYTVVNNNMIDGNLTIRVNEFTSQSQR